MAADQNPTAPEANTPDPAEDRMSIIQRRLAEIQNKAQDAPAAAAPAEAEALAPAPGVNPAEALPIEMPGQGTAPLPANQPAGAGTAEHTADSHPQLVSETPAVPSLTEMPAPNPGTPEAAAAAETAQHVPDAVTVDGHDISAPAARAMAHYGAGDESAASAAAAAQPDHSAPTGAASGAEAAALATPAEVPVADASDAAVAPVEAHAPASPAPGEAHTEAHTPIHETPEPVASSTPAPIADPENHLDAAESATVEEAAPEVPTADVQSAAEMEAAPEPVAALPTSSETPLPTAETAAESAHIGQEMHAETPVAGEADGETAHGGDAAPAAPSAEAAPDPNAPDFTGQDLPAQAAYLIEALRAPDARNRRKQLLDYARQYETNVGTVRAVARQKFAEGGADADAFAFQQPEGQHELNRALQEFRESGRKDRKAEDASRGDNLARKKELLDQLRELVEAADTKDTSNKLKTLQADWKATGPVPQSDSQSTWDTYHGLLDIYYSKQGRFLEMKDLDRRRNLEAKEVLIQRATALGSAPGINKALDELTKLHDDWKAIGPVPNEQREALWARFMAASNVLHQRRREFADARGEVEKAALEVKKALLDRILPFADFDTDRVNLWRSKTDEIQEIKQEWEAAGPVPRKQADALNKQYWEAYKQFFNRKNDFFKSADAEKNANVKAKQSLIDQVEEALNSTDWEQARNVVIVAQKQWKETGRVPEKLADKMWHRFRTAADAFFDRPKQDTRQREEKVTVATAEHTAHLDALAEQINGLGDEHPASLEGFRAMLSDWTAAFDPTDDHPGRSTGDRSEEQLLALLGQYLGKVPGLSYADQGDLLFQAEVARLKARPQAGQQLTRKEMVLRKEINELENDHATLQTNLDFFARSKNAAQLREEYQGRMDEAQKRITVLKKQLKMLRS